MGFYKDGRWQPCASEIASGYTANDYSQLQRAQQRIKELEARCNTITEAYEAEVKDCEHYADRCAKLEQALDVALEALETDDWMKKMAASKLLKEVRRD